MGSKDLGSTQMHFDKGHLSISFGRTFGRNIDTPSLFLCLWVQIGVSKLQDPWLLHVACRLCQKDTKNPEGHVFDDVDLLPNLQKVNIKNNINDKSFACLKDWLQSHHAHGGRSVDISFLPVRNQKP
jgi:hypothetical protein